MLEGLFSMFQYEFMVRAIAAGLLVSLCAALLGVSLVLKRYSMIGDGLSHVGFGALAIAAAMGWAELGVAIPVVVTAAVLLLRLSESAPIRGDAAIALISTGSLAVGVTAVSLSGANTDVMSYLFGSILAMSRGDVMVCAVLSAAVLVLFVFLYSRIFAVTFDEGFARAIGVKAGLYNTLLACLTAVTIVLGMRMMGALLISSLIIFPPLTAMRLFKTFRGVTVCSALVSMACFLTGTAASYLFSTPTGASVVLANILCLGIFELIRRATVIKREKKCGDTMA